MVTMWFIVAGVLLIGMALAGSALRRVPLTASMFYLGAGAALGPAGAGLLQLDAVEDAAALERVAEIAVIISLFTAGLKLRLPGSDRRWRAPILLASLAMALTVAGSEFHHVDVTRLSRMRDVVHAHILVGDGASSPGLPTRWHSECSTFCAQDVHY